MKRMNNKFKAASLVGFALVLGVITESRAQLNPLTAQYFQNEYLANPALAGASGSLEIYGGLRQQWSMIGGAPTSQALTADYRLKEKVGLGLNLFNDQAGLIKSTRVVGTYAYHLPLNAEGEFLRFGLSLGFNNQRVMNENIDGDQDDVSVGRFNQRETYVDGDFGVAYSGEKLTLQAALPNLKSYFQGDNNVVADRSTLYLAAGYKYLTNDGTAIEPKVAFRGISKYTDIVDAGVRVSMIQNQLLLSGMYHSTQNATFSLGMNFRAFSLLTSYTTATAALQAYTSGNFEVGLKYRFEKK